MAIDPDVEARVSPLEARILKLEQRMDVFEANPGRADPLVDAWNELTDAVNDAQDGLSRDERVDLLNRFAAQIRGA